MHARHTMNIAFVALALLGAAPAMAAEASGDCSVPISLGEKPSMGDFSDYSDFLVAIMGYKKNERDQKEQRKACPELYTKPPVVWDGPETLDEALAQADDQEPFDYQSNPTWYNRSTSQSIRLQDMPAGILSQELIQASLGTLEFGNIGQDEQTAMLLLEAINQATEDGRYGAVLGLNFDEWLSPQREAEATILALLLNNAGISEFIFSEDGGLVVALDDFGGLFGVDSYYEFESCLSSCGEFELRLTSNP